MQSRRRVISLVPDAFGGRGGIAAYGRNLLTAVCRHPDVGEVVALARTVHYELEPMPPNLRYGMAAGGSRLRYAAAVMALATRMGSADLVICGHLNLLPFAALLGVRFHCPVLPVVYGRDAWQPTPYRAANLFSRRIRSFIAIRRLTAERLKAWARIPRALVHYLPNCIDLSAFHAAPRRADLVDKYGLAGRTVIMTAGRIELARYEPNKGFDEVLETLPDLARDVPDATYLIVGDGEGTADLRAKARALGVADRVTFTGYVAEREKADHYRLADVVAMPGSSRNFDRYPFRFAFLEPLACGIPVVASRLVDPSEKDDADAKRLLIQVDPDDRADIRRGILEGLSRRGKGVDPGLAKFSYEAFEKKVVSIVSATMMHG
ncbi:MAG: glycosyltransferase family 4 protein [Bauldia sp.]